MPEPSRGQGALSWIFRLSLGLAILSGFAGIFLFSPEIDEAWILTSVHNLYELGLYTCEFLPGTRTTGGLHTAFGYLSIAAAGFQLPLLRLGPFLALLAIVWMIGRLLPSAYSRSIPAALVLAVPGTLALAGLAYGLFYAFLLLLLAVLAWERCKEGWQRILFCGLLFGFAAATRVNFMVIFPALALWGLVNGRANSRIFRDSLLTAIWGFVVFQAAFRLLSLYSGATIGVEGTNFAGATGLGKLFAIDYPHILNKWLLVERNMSLPLLVLGSLSLLWLTRVKLLVPRSVEILLIFAWMVWAALLWVSPLANLRYYWPALAVFGMGMGLSLSVLYHDAARASPLRAGILTLCMACTLGASATQVRQLVYGNSSAISHEWAGHSPYMRYRRFQAVQDYWAMVETLKARVGEQDLVGTLGPGFDLALFSQRRVVDWRHLQPGASFADKQPGWLVLSQMQLGYLNLDAGSQQWLTQHAELVQQHGAYALYRLDADASAVVKLNYRIYFDRRHPAAESIVQYH